MSILLWAVVLQEGEVEVMRLGEEDNVGRMIGDSLGAQEPFVKDGGGQSA